jgi:hypothetical protein
MRTNKRGQFVKVQVAERFWSKVDKNGPMHPTDPSLGRCWIWVSIIKKGPTGGYGLIWDQYHRKRLRAHRVAWELMNKQRIPKSKHLLHSCDRPPCVNPKHTYLGTDADNHRDMVVRGRSLIGEKNPMAQLTEAQVRKIRQLYPLTKRTGPRTMGDKKIITKLCKSLDISQNLAYRVASGERWNHVTP